MRLLVTGGAGFMGSAFVRQALQGEVGARILVVDSLTYAGNLANLAPVEDHPALDFERFDIRDATRVRTAFRRFRPEAVLHFAAESHVDRSILDPALAVSTNVQGTAVLLEAAREHPPSVFVHISTDEVYGSTRSPDLSDEHDPLRPSSPYSASKAAADLLAMAYGSTYSLPVIVTRSCNNYGPFQFPEKLIPLMICSALDGDRLPVYGDGQQVRQWLHVEDHARAIRALLERGRPHTIYNVPGNCRLPNLEVVRRILQLAGRPRSLVEFVADRPAHDRRYAVRGDRIMRDTGWEPTVEFDSGLSGTFEWYRRNRSWVERARS